MKDATSTPIVVLLTAASRGEADQLAEILVSNRLAACVQILPQIESVYRWKGEVRREPEFLLLVKTVMDKFIRLEDAVRANHSYETPEILAIPAEAISQSYLDWMVSSLG